jgi:hypothetical protein
MVQRSFGRGAVSQSPSHISSASPARTAVFWLILVLLACAAIEVGAAAICWFVVLPRARDLVWAPDLDRARANWINATAEADAELGWPSPSRATKPPYDVTGAKDNAEFPEPGRACASAYGDSFVWGADIAPADGWIERLAHLLGCRVANYGVSGYGTDQALLRFRRNDNDEAPLVLLGIFPENVLRNVNQYRGLMGYELDPFSLKGRFVLEAAGNLDWIPRPRLDAEGFTDLNRAPAGFLPHEYLLPDTRDGPVTLRFPYVFALLRIALMPRVWTYFTGRPSWSGFFAVDHPSGALPLTVAIADALAREAGRRGKRTLVVMLPGGNSFRLRPADGTFEYAPLVAALTAKGIDVFDTGPALLSALGKRSYCVLYSQPDGCGGHFGRFGSTIVAEVVAAELRRRGLVKQ